MHKTIVPLRVNAERRPCSCRVRYSPMASFRPCRKPATYRVGKRFICGTHANALAIRILLGATK